MPERSTAEEVFDIGERVNVYDGDLWLGEGQVDGVDHVHHTYDVKMDDGSRCDGVCEAEMTDVDGA